MLSKFCNTLSFVHGEQYIIGRSDFISSLRTQLFYNTIVEMDYGVFGEENILDSIQVKDAKWQVYLIEQVINDFSVLKTELKNYLLIISKKYTDIPCKFSTSEISMIQSADAIYTFNYTKFIEKYAEPHKVKYVHGSLDDEIILGIPYSEIIDIKEFNFIFKTSQSVELKLNMPLFDNKTRSIELYFVGFSFGKSDHYFFQEIKDEINSYLSDQFVPGATAEIYINIYYHTKKSIANYIYNLREFMGEEMMTRFDLNNKITFIPYEELT